MKKRFEICPVEKLKPGERRIVELKGISIGIFNVDGEYHALKNECPHRRVELCQGAVTGTVTASQVGEYNWEKEGEILRCPAHGWEFDITNGESIFNPHKVKAMTFDTTVETHEHEDGDTDAKATAVEDGNDPAADEDSGDGADAKDQHYGTALEGDEPPVDTFDVREEDDVVVVYM